MSVRIFDATTFIAENDTTNVTTSRDYHSLTIAGDTLQLVVPRSPSTSSATGNVGEICWGSETILGITTHYLYVCIATNTWKRTPLVTW